ncbi:MAG: MinD/ParA family protein [Gammaproteobacteria bacterium HGW-Gammaproteobacteria-10]|uniref:MinD/ParA family protein n=1 Tax=Methylotuvimicrobium buryatense TaxID=95641 RepID=A0A4P9UQ59_METBY|nr:MinD/ParA family protein [Methylotuvimicrobium buryatense]PKM36737.1 MAG: MinD/ParA family protein [Gammaproteobacteria bacterium HGW-Gammaproteobacteria-10]QCW83559.1 MinD/ParA family protein [Methylotuvimicrobium buryatense]
MKKTNPVRVIAVTSGKGGVGKTNLSVNLGLALAEQGKRVALLDADMGLANVDVLLGMYPKFNLSHVLKGEKTLSEIIVTGPSGLQVIPASSGLQHMSDLSTVEQAAVIRAFSDIDQDLDVLIVDTAAGISSSVINFARACQEVIVVVCDEPTSLTDAYAFIKLLNRDYGLSRFHILTNMVQSAQQGQNLFLKLTKVTDRYLDVTLQFAGAVPYDEYLRKAVQQQSPVVAAYPRSKSSLALKNVARQINSWPIKGQAGGYLEFFIERMIQYGAQKDVA